MAPRKIKRDTELAGNTAVTDQLQEIFKDITAGFQDQRERADTCLDNWDLYEQRLTDRQFYNGQSQIFLPYVHDAVEARKTRFSNQLFPQSGRCVAVTTTEEQIPQATMSLLESYIRKAKLKTTVVQPMLVNGDVEGTYNLYVSWREEKRETVVRTKKANVTVKGAEFNELGEHDAFEDESDTLARPDVEVLRDSDVLVLPVTASSVDDAIAAGGSVTIKRRWTKGKVRKMIKAGEIAKDCGDELIDRMDVAQRNNREIGNKILDAAGVKNRGREVLIYETWTEVKVKGEYILCRAFYGGDDNVLGCKPNPYWCNKVPLISCPVNKTSGSFKAKAPVEAVADLQILANDCINEGADTGHFSAMPIVMTDPEKNPRVSSMVLGLAAVWETNPNDTQFAEFPQLWEGAMGRAIACQQQIFMTLGVNPSMITGSTGGDNKKNQAEIANEQAVDVLTTADACQVVEEGILTPLLGWFAALDHQFREDAVTIEVYGQLGVRAKMERVEPIQLNNRWEFRWMGVESSRNAAQVQQKIAGMNVMNGIPPQKYPGYKMNMAPLLVQLTEDMFGSELAPLIFEKEIAYSVDPLLENDMLQNGFEVAIHMADNDMEHLAAHMGLLDAHDDGVDPHGTIRDHIAKHQMQMKLKAEQQAAAMQPPPGLPGVPGGAGPGVAGTPPPGVMPEGPRLMKGPPGMIHPDNMGAADPSTMPRQ